MHTFVLPYLMIASTSIGALKRESVLAVNVPITALGLKRSKDRSYSLTTGVVSGMIPGPERWECITYVLVDETVGGLRKSARKPTSIYIQFVIL